MMYNDVHKTASTVQNLSKIDDGHRIKISLFPNNPGFSRPCKRSILKTLREKEKMLETSNFSFPTMFSTLSEKKCTISAALKLSSANAFNLDKSNFCRMVNVKFVLLPLNILSTMTIWESSQLHS